MKFMNKIILMAFVLALVFALSFAIWGDTFEAMFSQSECIRWFSEIKSYAWMAGIGLLVSDILLPVPASGIMAALAQVYGLWAGVAISAAGSFAAGTVGYLAARYLGEKRIGLLASSEEIERFRRFFDTYGGSAIIISRILPILPEVMTILAGLAGMKPSRFYLSLFLGTLPVTVLFSFLGHTSAVDPGYGILIAIVIPLFLWPFFVKYVLSNGSQRS